MGVLRDRVLAVVIGVLAFAWYLVFAPKGIPPELWGEMSVAASLRSPQTVFPGLARYLSMALFGGFDFGTACALISLLGKVLCAFSAGFAYRILRYVLQCTGTPLEIATPRRRLAIDVICTVCTVMFVVSQPMLETSEALSVDSLSLFLSFAAMAFFFRFLDRGGFVNGGMMLLLFGVITAETVTGAVLALVAAVLYLLSIRGLTGFIPRPPSPYVMEIFKWRATMAFALGFLGTVAFNLGMFLRCGGLEANGLDFPAAVLRYLSGYGEVCAALATGAGWFLVLLVVIFPLVLALSLLPASMSDEKFLKWRLGVCYAMLAVVSALQLGSVGELWFRSWSRSPCLTSNYLVDVCSFLSAVTLAISLGVLAYEAFFRNYRRIFRLKLDAGCERELDFAAPRKRRIAIAVLVPCALLALAWPFGNYRVRGEMRGLLDEAVAETVRELGDAKRVFTDGVFDDAIELGALRENGRRVYALSMMADSGAYQEYLRLRGGEFAGEDLQSVKTSAAAAFRDWVLHRPERVAESAFMLGFEMWRAAAKAEPEGSGFLARTVYPEGEPERGIVAAKVLAGRILAFCEGCPEARRAAAGAILNRFFAVMVWRLSRLCVLRADALDRHRHGGDSAASERELARRLDAVNPYLPDLDRHRLAVADRTGQHVAVRDRLKLALMRADFRSAANYAETVVITDPGNVDANFALGMHGYFSKNYALAEARLVRALEGSPRDGAIWNNLAMCRLRLGALEEAEKAALEAVRLLPGSTAASNTLVEIRKAKEDRK